MAQGTEGVLLDREGARQTVVGENSVIFLLDTILQGRLGSGKNSPVSHVKQSERHTRIPEHGDSQSPCLSMNICTAVQERHVSSPQLRLSKPKLDGRAPRLRSTQRTAWWLCLPRIANVLVFSIHCLSHYPATLSGAVYSINVGCAPSSLSQPRSQQGLMRGYLDSSSPDCRSLNLPSLAWQSSKSPLFCWLFMQILSWSSAGPWGLIEWRYYKYAVYS